MLRIGILGFSDIAYNRFLPALTKADGIVCVGVAKFSEDEPAERGQRFIDRYELPIFPSFDSLIESDEVDAVYLPTPPATHYEWAKKVLRAGKHALVEKPITCHLHETKELLKLAEQKDLAIFENFMFLYHSQLQQVKKWISDDKLGELRQISAWFGFPKRSPDDFRYNKALGGGARLDAAGYLVKLADFLMEEPSVVASTLNDLPGFSVDMFGSMMLVDKEGLSFHGSFGMDNSYRCELDIWGSKGRLYTDRILTAPPNFRPRYTLTFQNGSEEYSLPADDHFLHSIERFVHLVKNPAERADQSAAIVRGSQLLEDLLTKS